MKIGNRLDQLSQSQIKKLIIFMSSLIGDGENLTEGLDNELIAYVSKLMEKYYGDLMNNEPDKDVYYTVCFFREGIGGYGDNITQCLEFNGGFSAFLIGDDYPPFIDFVEGRTNYFTTMDKDWGFSIERLKDNA